MLTHLLSACSSPGDDGSADEADDPEDPSDGVNRGDGDDTGRPEGDGDGSFEVPRPTYSETSGGHELPPHEVLQGTVTVVGSSAAVPVSNRSFSGFRDPIQTGSELVRCNYHPSGNADYAAAHVDVLAGIQGYTHYQLQAQLFEFEPGGEVALPLTPEANLDDGSQSLIVIASLTHDGEDGAYRYWYTTDEYAYPPYGSTCSVYVEELSDERLAGTISCQDLFAVPDSPDAPVTNAPYPTAQISIQFDCPVVYRDPRGAQYEPGGDRSCSGSPDPCVLMSHSECLSSPGCIPSGTCSGIARSCDEYVEFYSCESQTGCLWSGFECYGIPESCYQFDGDDLGCLLHDGCDWQDDCEGTALACDNFYTAETCEEHGCGWSE